jgi:threonine/homoserine/homoserine lactone efflux protein
MVEYIILMVLESIILGISVSAPMGPMGVMVVQRTLNKGRTGGFVSGLGVALGDTTYAVLAAAGVSLVHFDSHNVYFRLIGGTVLIAAGVHMYFQNPVKQYKKSRKGKKNRIGDLISMYFLTITNPLTFIFFGASFAALGFSKYGFKNSYLIVIALSVMLGAVMWWLFITTLVNTFRQKIKLRHLFWVNRIAAILIILLAVISLIGYWFETLGVTL